MPASRVLESEKFGKFAKGGRKEAASATREPKGPNFTLAQYSRLHTRC